MKKALLTGASGFVGRYFCQYLKQEGWEVHANDIVKETHNYWDKYYETDCRKLFAIIKPKFDLIIHCAAVVGGRLNLEKNQIAVASDLSIDAEFFNWVKSCPKHTRIVYFSSSAAYPIHLQESVYKLKEVDIDLYDIRQPDMTYGWVKLTGEMVAHRLHIEYDKRVTVLRPFSGYGLMQDLTYPFPSIIKRVVEKQHPVEIWGNGNQVRDFIHISDIVNATMILSEERTKANAINLCTGIPTSFIELATMAHEQMWGQTPYIKTDTTKPTGPAYRCGDETELLKYYLPTVTLEQGINIKLNESKSISLHSTL
jgi:nucleoside-diphosphate-sugar epimerase